MNWTLVGALFALVAVGAGAFGAHGLRESLSPARMETFEVAVRYQMYHSLAILVAGILQSPVAAWCFVAGIAVFSGSLYILVLTNQRWLGAVTPIGGVLLLLGWLALAIAPRR